MTKHKHIWTSEEEQALYAGVEKYGTGKWKKILKDPRYSAILVDRSNVDLKDKWRNLHAALNGSRSRGKVKTLTTGKTTNHRLASSVPLVVISPIEYGGGSCIKYGGGSRTEHGGGYIEYGGGSRIKYSGNSHIEYGGGSRIEYGGSSHIEHGGSSGNKKPGFLFPELPPCSM
nr:telomere repeat-binding factor 1-like [Tanacetum cinerariifolium]